MRAVLTQAGVAARVAAAVHLVAHRARDQAAAALHRAVQARVAAAAVVVARAAMEAVVRIVAMVLRARAAVIHVVRPPVIIGAVTDARMTTRIERMPKGVRELKLILRLIEIETATVPVTRAPLRWARTAIAIGTAPEMKTESQIATEIATEIEIAAATTVAGIIGTAMIDVATAITATGAAMNTNGDAGHGCRDLISMPIMGTINTVPTLTTTVITME